MLGHASNPVQLKSDADRGQLVDPGGPIPKVNVVGRPYLAGAAVSRAGLLATTSSINPKALAWSESMKRSRSMASSIAFRSCPVWRGVDLFQQARIDVEGPLAAVGLLDHHGY